MKAKNIYSIVLTALLCASMIIPAHADQGESCSDPITLTQDFSENITSACEKWYVANTFDLPLAINFYPKNESDAAPDLELDFSCTPGVYEDSILCGLFCWNQSAYVSLPHKETPSPSYDDNHRIYYHVAFGEFYRDLLLRQGIDYNVRVYVKAKFYGKGELTMAPDPFNNCMDGHKFMHLGDTVQVQAKDKDRHVIVPYVQWQYDSIRYVWQGTTHCTFAVGHKCGFDPTDGSESSVIDRGIIQPGEAFKVSSELLMEYVNNQTDFPNDAGMYFAKFYSDEPGVIKIEKIPTPPPGGGATILKYGQKEEVKRNDTTSVYAITRSWQRATLFTTPAERVFRMYIGTTANFYTKDAIVTYQFTKTEEGHELGLFAKELEKLWKKTSDNYLYIRIECAENTTILPTFWYPNECAINTSRLEADSMTIELPRKTDAVYSLLYDDWKGGEWTFNWLGATQACIINIGDSCSEISAETDPHTIVSQTLPKQSQWVLPAEAVDTLASYVDPDGYLYICFYGGQKAKITITTSTPKEEDPECHTVDTVFNVEAWDAYELRGVSYTKSGTYEVSTDDTWCPDTIYTFQLTIHTTAYDTLRMDDCDSIEYEGTIYFENTELQDTIATEGGDRLIRTTYLTVNRSSYAKETIIQFEPYIVPATGEVYEESVILTDSLKTIAGCDSIIVHDITIGTVDMDTIPLSGCDSVVYEDRTFTRSGMYSDTVQTSESHYAVTTYAVEIGYTTATELVIKEEDEYLSPAGNVYTKSGDYIDTIPNATGCDSIITIHLSIYTMSYDTLDTMFGCNMMVFEKKVYTKSCTFNDTLIDLKGNLTVRTISIIIGHTSYAEETTVKNGSYTSPRGNVYTESGDYTETLTNIEGCDSVITLHITIGNAKYDTIYFCSGYNREHEEQVNELLIRYYTPYTYKSPASFNYKDSLVIETRDDQVLLDLHRVESILNNHYVEPLTPIESIAWSIRHQGESAYTPIEVQDEPQWVKTGILAVQILFHCGEIYNDALPMGIEETAAEQAPIKRIVDGQVFIIRGNAVYTTMGVKVGRW